MFRALGRSLLCLVVYTSGSLAVADQESFAQAARLYQQGQWQQAVALFQRCAQNDTNRDTRAAASFYLGECLMQLSSYKEASNHYRDVLQQSKEGIYTRRAQFRVGEAAWLEADAESAEAELQTFVHQHPHDPLASYAYTYLGDIALSTRDWQRAIAAYRTVIDRYAPSPRVKTARLGLARALLGARREHEVPVALGNLAKDEDRTLAAEAMLLEGRWQYQAGQYENALASFRGLYRRFANENIAPRARVAAAWALWKLDRFDAIDSELAPLAEETRWAVDRHYLLGMAAYGKRQWAPAIEQLSQAAEASQDHPSYEAILFYAGESCLRDGQYEEARRWYQQLSTNHPQSIWTDDALWGLARTAQATDSPDQFTAIVAELRQRFPASVYLERFQQLATDQGDAIDISSMDEGLDEAVSLERDGRYDAALAAYRKTLANRTQGAARIEAIRRAARLHDRLSQNGEARRLYEQLLAEDSASLHTTETIYALAWLYVRTGDLLAAGDRFREVHEKFPQSAQASEAAYWLALAAADDKDSALALQYVGGLIEKLSLSESSLSPRQRNLWGQAVCLKCQLAASAGQWQQIEDTLAHVGDRLDEGALRMRTEFWLAEAQFRTKKYDQASASLNNLQLQLVGLAEPWVPMVPLRRAQIAARRQQWTEVLKIVDLLDREYPDFQLLYEVDYLRGRARAGRGEMKAARRAYRRVLENKTATNTETATMAQWMIGESFFHQRVYDRALKSYMDVIDHHAHTDWQARAALQAGKCLELEAQWEEARALYATALKRWRGSEPEEQLQARLQWTNKHVAGRKEINNHRVAKFFESVD